MSELTDKDISVYIELDLTGSESPIELNLDLLQKFYRTVCDDRIGSVFLDGELKIKTVFVVLLIRRMTDLGLLEAASYAKTIRKIYPLNIFDAHEKGFIFIDFKNERKQ
jgi:hypothetical protein